MIEVYNEHAGTTIPIVGFACSMMARLYSYDADQIRTVPFCQTILDLMLAGF